MSSNIVAIVRYKKDVNFQKLVGGWCKYVSKDGADGKSLKDFSSSDELFDKEFGIYDDTIDNDVNYIWDKNGDIKKENILKDLPKDESGRMWNLVISFPPDFALESGLKTKQDYYMMTKSIMPRFLLDNDFDLTNTRWYASKHNDTDNPHLHITIFEKEIRRKKDTLEKSSIKYLKSNDIWICGTDMNTNKYYYEENYNIPIAFVIGSEGFGISRLVKENCDFLVKIPMSGKISSLNASVSAGIVMYEAVKQRKNK